MNCHNAFYTHNSLGRSLLDGAGRPGVNCHKAFDIRAAPWLVQDQRQRRMFIYPVYWRATKRQANLTSLQNAFGTHQGEGPYLNGFFTDCHGLGVDTNWAGGLETNIGDRGRTCGC